MNWTTDEKYRHSNTISLFNEWKRDRGWPSKHVEKQLMTSYDVSFYGAQALWSNNDPVWESVTDEVTCNAWVPGVADVYTSPSVTTDQIICNMHLWIRLNWSKVKIKATCFIWSLSLLNVTTKLDYQWAHLEATSLSLSHQFLPSATVVAER